MGGMGTYGGYGGMGGYGGLGGGYGGYGGFGGPNAHLGMGPHNFDPNLQPGGAPSLSQTLTNSTQSTFQLLESMVITFSGFSQLLESTFMMTQSSFFTFVQLIEQFNFFKFSIGKILSLFDLIKWLKNAISGQSSLNSTHSWRDSFKSFEKGDPNEPTSSPPTPSRKPIVIFFLTIFGIPYLMNKLIKSIAAKQQQQEAERQAQFAATGLDPLQQQTTLAIDPSKLSFVRALHAYHPTASGGGTEAELAFEKGDIIAVLAPNTKEERDQLGWWKGRLRNGTLGWFPRNYVEEIPLPSIPSPDSKHDQKLQRILAEEAEAGIVEPNSQVT